MTWARPEPITGGVVYGRNPWGFSDVEVVVPLDNLDGEMRECVRAYIQGDLAHLAICLTCQEDGLAQEEGVLDGYPEPPDYRLLTPHPAEDQDEDDEEEDDEEEDDDEEENPS